MRSMEDEKRKDYLVHKIKLFACLFLVLLLAGCKTQLYTGLSEREGNDMLAMLLSSGISATKELNKDLQMTLFVSTSDVARAIQLLRSNGYPGDNFSSVSDIFPKDSLISSPVEERARYTYSMSQELSSTLSMIDGVITARVHVVLPQEANGIQENPFPSSAAIFIKYSSDLVLSGFIPKVKTLVSNSIEGLSLDKITVTLFPASISASENMGYKSADRSMQNVLTIEVSLESRQRLILLLSGMLILLLLAFATAGVSVLLMIRQKNSLPEFSEELAKTISVKNDKGPAS